MQVLKAHCVSCHNGDKRKGGLDLTSREAMMVGGDEGVVVVEGQPEASTLFTSLAAEADPHMPPKKQLAAAPLAVLESWLRAGAPWDAAALAGGAGGGPTPPRPVALAPLPAGYRPVMALALSPDGSRLAAGCGHEVVIFAVGPAGLSLRARARAHLDPVQSIAWTPDGRRLITGAFRRVMIWDAEGLAPEREILSGLTDRITALQVTPDGGRVLLADGLTAESGVVRVLEVATGQVARSWPAHDDTIFAMTLNAEGTRLATAGGDRLVRVWDVATGTETAKLEAHSTQVLCLSFNSDSSQLVTGGADRQLKVWDVKTRENTIALAAKTSAFTAVVWNSAGPVFAVTDDGSVLRYTDMKAHTGAQSSDTGNERQLGQAGAALYCLASTAGGERIFAGTCDGRVLAWDQDGKPLAAVDVTPAGLAAAAAAATSTPPPPNQ